MSVGKGSSKKWINTFSHGSSFTSIRGRFWCSFFTSLHNQTNKLEFNACAALDWPPSQPNPKWLPGIWSQVFWGSGALWRKRQYMNLAYWGCFSFCQNTAKLVTQCCMVLQTSTLCWLLQQTPAMYILIKSHKTEGSLTPHTPDMHPTCTRTCTWINEQC